MPLTTDDTVGRDLRASLNLREGVPAGTTWGTFKAAMTILGVKDDDRLGSIEFGISQWGGGRIVREDEAGGVDIKEIRA